MARRLGFAESFAYAHAADVFREHAALSAFENEGERFFDIGGLATLDNAAYDRLEPVQWPVPVGESAGTPRLSADGVFPTKDGRGRFVAVSHRAPVFDTDATYRLILNTGRLRDQWHTMTRTGLVPRLAAHMPEPCVDLNPADAATRAVCDGDLIRLSSRWGSAIARARIAADQPQGSVFLPMHWTKQFAGDCVVGRVVNPAIDPISHQPELKHTPVEIERIEAKFEARLITTRHFKPEGIGHWTRHRAEGCEVYSILGTEPAQVIAERAEALLAPDAETGLQLIEYRDPARGVARLARIGEEGLAEILFVGPAGSLPETEAVIQLFADRRPLDAACRSSLLSGRIAGAAPSAGRIVCTCFQVGIEVIRAAVSAEGITNVRALGERLRAGTNWGSCKPELQEIIAEARAAAAE